MNQENTPSDTRTSPYYRISIQGHFHPRWSDWFAPMMISQQPDGTTTLQGPVIDQAFLYGLLIKLRDLGVTLLSVQILTD